MPSEKRKFVIMDVFPKKRKKSASASEEINFDFKAREDYLTGFHKRKLQRIKVANEEAAKKERQDKIITRRSVSFISNCESASKQRIYGRSARVARQTLKSMSRL